MHILTFDIEDWFHTHQNRKHHSGHTWQHLPSRVQTNTKRILDFLDGLELKASFFILGWVAEQHPRLVKEIHSRGHEIGTHSFWHHNANLLRPVDFEKDLKRSISILNDITGEAVISHRAPGFSLNQSDQWAFEILASQGIQIDSSVEHRRWKRSNPFGISVQNSQILEFPLVKTACFLPYTGGGYFRAMPDKVLTKLFESEDYRLLYFHPRDFDGENPYSNLFSLSRNWLNGYRTGDCLNRLKAILLQYPSMTLNEAAQLYTKKTAAL